MSLLTDGKLAKTIATALQSVLYPITLTRIVPGGYQPGTGAVGAGSTTTHSCRGMVEDFDSMSLQKAVSYLDDALVRVGDRKVLIAAATLATTPFPSDKLTANGKTFVIQSVSADPAGATWSLVVR
jgi:hypothetical protein